MVFLHTRAVKHYGSAIRHAKINMHLQFPILASCIHLLHFFGCYFTYTGGNLSHVRGVFLVRSSRANSTLRKFTYFECLAFALHRTQEQRVDMLVSDDKFLLPTTQILAMRMLSCIGSSIVSVDHTLYKHTLLVQRRLSWVKQHEEEALMSESIQNILCTTLLSGGSHDFVTLLLKCF